VTLQELVDKAISIASAGLPASLSPALSADMIAEDLLESVFGEVAEQLARSPNTRHLLRRTKVLNVVDGEVTLPADVLTQYFSDASLYDPADVTKRYSIAEWPDLISGSLDPRLGHFIINEGLLTVVEPDQQFEANNGPTLTVRLTIACSPEVPASAGNAIDARDEVVDRIVERLAQRLRPASK
jgi:hypothetical protein